jgi:hypothetical protein
MFYFGVGCVPFQSDRGSQCIATKSCSSKTVKQLSIIATTKNYLQRYKKKYKHCIGYIYSGQDIELCVLEMSRHSLNRMRSASHSSFPYSTVNTKHEHAKYMYWRQKNNVLFLSKLCLYVFRLFFTITMPSLY